MPSGYIVEGNKAIKDLTDKELVDYQKKAKDGLDNICAVLNSNIQQVQIASAVLNVIQYEQDRRKNSIQLAGLNDLPGKKP